MRIVAGLWAGRRLTSPAKRVRPTSENTRVAWLDALDGELQGARILDLFAGSGALGLEALSRGAAVADFVENGPASLHSLKANVASLRVTKRTRIFKRDAIPFVERLSVGAYDIAFVDPPYGSRKLDRVVARWIEVPFARILGVEHATAHPLPHPGRTIAVGDTSVTLFGAGTNVGDPPPTQGARRQGQETPGQKNRR